MSFRIHPFLFLLVLIFCACQKDQRTSDTDGNAQYSFSGTAASCSSVTPNGIYKIGAALTPTNTVDVSVDVSLPGKYKVYTDTVNGLFFSQDSAFTSTGAQSIRLQGNGKPLKSGTFTFLLQSARANCSFRLTIDTLQPYATNVYSRVHGTGHSIAYNSNMQATSIYPSVFWINTPRIFSYSPAGRLTTVQNGSDSKDSLVYDPQNRLQQIYQRKLLPGTNTFDPNPSRVDSFTYDGQGFISSRISSTVNYDQPTQSYQRSLAGRLDFMFDADSNLTSVTEYFYQNNEWKPTRKTTYGSYDSYKNPLYKITGVALNFPGVLKYSVNNLDVPNYAQLSPHNPRLVTEYVITSQGTWFLNESQQLAYAYGAGGTFLRCTNGLGEQVMSIEYVYK